VVRGELVAAVARLEEEADRDGEAEHRSDVTMPIRR